MLENKIDGISFVIPAYNSAKTIGGCLISLVTQDYPKKDYEIIVVDDGSTDDTVKEIEKFRTNKKFFQRVRLIRQRHGGPAKARNTGWKSAKSDTIVFVDSDIALPEDALRIFNKRVRYGADVLVMGEHNEEFGFETESLPLSMHGFHPPKDITVVNKLALKAVGGYCETFPWAGGEDTDMLIRIMKEGISTGSIIGNIKQCYLLWSHGRSAANPINIWRAETVNIGYTQLGEHRMTVKKQVKRTMSNLYMNFRNLDTWIAWQWLIGKFTGVTLLKMVIRWTKRPKEDTIN